MMNFVTRVDLVTEACKQRMKFVKTSVYVADDVEWSVFMLAIVCEPLALDNDGVNFFRGLEFVNMPEALTFQIA